jgi:hypothetical protein
MKDYADETPAFGTARFAIIRQNAGTAGGASPARSGCARQIRRSVHLLLCLGVALLAAGQVKAQSPGDLGGKAAPTARVIEVEDPSALHFLVPNPEKVQAMVDRGITALTGKDGVGAAWATLVSTNDTVGIKVLSAPGANSGTRLDVVAGVVRGLLAAGLPPGHIIVWDRHVADLRRAGFFDLEKRFGIRVEGAIEAGFDEKLFYESPLLGTLVYGDLEFGKTGQGIGRNSYVSKLVSQQMTKIINVTPLLHHNIVGVSGNLYNLAAGSVDNVTRFENTAEDLSRAMPEIYALPVIGDRVVLNIMDALLCQYDGQDRAELHYSVVLNQLWFSRDPVALDVLALDEINHQREVADVPLPKTTPDLLFNATLLEIGMSDPHRIKVEKIR